jgi:hypothetical protein
LADFEFGDGPAANGDLVFDPIQYENTPVGPDGRLSFQFSNKAPATTTLTFGEPDGLPLPVDLAFSGTMPGLAKYIPLEEPAVAVNVSGTMPGLTAVVGLIGRIDINVSGSLPALQAASGAVRPSTPVSVSGQMPGLVMLLAEARYFTRTQRPTVGKTDAPHQVASKVQTGPSQPQQDTVRKPVGWETFWQRVTNGSQTIEHKLPADLQAVRNAQRDNFQRGARAHDDTLGRSQDATAIWQNREGVFQNATKTRNGTLYRHQDGTKTHARRQSSYDEALKLHVAAHYGGFQSATALLKGLIGAFQDGVPPPAGISIYVPPQPPGPTPCYLPDSNLVFQYPWTGDTRLFFICDGEAPPEPPVEPIIVPVQRVYIVLNNLALRRTSDNAVVPAFRFSLSLDVSSWSWGFSASLPATSQALVEPTTGPVELSAWVNGQEFRVLAEQVGRERSFGQTTISISGRGRNAFLDAPYAPVQTFGNTIARTHQQLFDDVLTFNGVPMGWNIDYGLEAWNIPAGVWNHQGTYIGALNALAQPGGAYLIPHPSAQSFKVRHLYPAKPWEWDTVTPDFVLPADVVSREGLTWKEKPAYNRVYVSGAEQGVLGRVTRAGTAGDLLAPMVADPLITTAAAARQRGLAVLGDTGKQIEHQLRLPVLQATGIIQPGAFVEYTDNGASRIGIVRSTQVDAQMPDVWQTLGVEVHDYA